MQPEDDHRVIHLLSLAFWISKVNLQHVSMASAGTVFLLSASPTLHFRGTLHPPSYVGRRRGHWAGIRRGRSVRIDGLLGMAFS